MPSAPLVREKGRLGDHLLDRHLITQAQLDQALAEQRESGQKLGNILVGIGALDEQVLADVLGSYFGLVALNLRRENVDPEALSLVPEDVARDNCHSDTFWRRWAADSSRGT